MLDVCKNNYIIISNTEAQIIRRSFNQTGSPGCVSPAFFLLFHDFTMARELLKTVSGSSAPVCTSDDDP